MVAEPVQVHRPALWGEEQATVCPYAFSSVAFFLLLFFFFFSPHSLFYQFNLYYWVFPKSCDNIPLVLREGRNTSFFSCVSRTCAQVSANFGGLDAKIQNFRVPRESLIIIIMQSLLYQLLNILNSWSQSNIRLHYQFFCSSYLTI